MSNKCPCPSFGSGVRVWFAVRVRVFRFSAGNEPNHRPPEMNKLPTPGDWHNRKMGVPLCSPRHCMSGFVACFVVAHGVVVSLWWSSYNTNNHSVGHFFMEVHLKYVQCTKYMCSMNRTFSMCRMCSMCMDSPCRSNRRPCRAEERTDDLPPPPPPSAERPCAFVERRAGCASPGEWRRSACARATSR